MNNDTKIINKTINKPSLKNVKHVKKGIIDTLPYTENGKPYC
jgi:hypothetical protein